MKAFRPRMLLRSTAVAALFGVAIAVAGCGEISRIQQCNAVTGVINGGGGVLKELNTAKDLDARAAEIEAFDQKVAAVDVDRPELKGFVDEYRKLLADVAAYARDMKTATDYGTVERRSKELVAREKNLLERMNAYCRGG